MGALKFVPTLAVGPLVVKAGADIMPGAKAGRVKTTLACEALGGGGGGAGGVVVGVLGPEGVAEEVAVEPEPEGVGWAVGTAPAVAIAAAYWPICCMMERMKSGGKAPGDRGERLPLVS